MKLTELKKVLKETVREVIQEELKDILLEAIKTPKVVTQTPVMESLTTSPPIPSPTTPVMSSQDKRDAYKNILGETAKVLQVMTHKLSDQIQEWIWLMVLFLQVM